MEVDGLSNDQFFFWLRFLDTFCSMGEWVLCVIANWEYRGVVFSCKIGCLHTSTWRSTAYCRYLIAKRQRNFTGNIDVRSSKTALVHTCIGPCPIKNIYIIWYVCWKRSNSYNFTRLYVAPTQYHVIYHTTTTFMEDIRQAYCSINRDVNGLTER